MNILFDTNVILDALLERSPFLKETTLLFDAVEESVINGFICADSITTIYYLVTKGTNRKTAQQKIKLLLELFDVAPVNRPVLEDALSVKFNDFEDAVIYQSARSVNADGIVTRNPKDFKKSKISVYSPRELITAINSS